jgi:ABC-type lipoprotein export system ATPase subunit
VTSLIALNFSALNILLPNGLKFIGELDLQLSQMYHLNGPNGVGKTSFFNLFERFLNAKSISYNRCFQSDLNCIDDALEVQALLQDCLLLPSQAERMSLISDSLAIDELLTLKVSKLSGGESQRLKLYLALAPLRQLYLLDEPFNHLEQKYIINCLHLFENLIKNHHLTFIISDHQKRINGGCDIRLKRDQQQVEIELTKDQNGAI